MRITRLRTTPVRATPSRVSRLNTWVALAAVALMAAACSGSSTSTTDTTTTVSVSAPATTTTTPVVKAATVTTLPATEPSPPVAQFTGIEVAEELTQPAILIKIDNHQNARPQRGINNADVVFEELVEGNITRLATIFHSQEADPVGPVRSARTGDFALLTNLNTPLFANSGGNPTVMNLVRNVDAVLISDANVGSPTFYRGGGKAAPHNLLTTTAAIRAAADGAGGTPAQFFAFRKAGAPLPDTAEDVGQIRIDYGGYRIDFVWDPAVSGWARSQQGTPHVDADGLQIAFENVIVQYSTYGSSVAFAGSPEVKPIGTGEAWVLTAGRLIRAEWSRPTSEAITEYRDINGDIVELTPGRTWVALPRPGSGSLLED